jgi:catechol 2,3-dioxygenase-like lactoylglutathione lyase family enzyme
MIETSAATYDVGGVLLERPFKIRRLGHFGLNALKMEECVKFYTEDLGYRISDKRNFGERAKSQEAIAGFGDPHGYFMRYGTDHHSFVLFNKRVREYIDTERHFAPGVVMNQISWQVGSLGEVSNGCDWLNEEGLKIQRSGRDMPGSNWHTYFYDPDGHTNELYYGMEQVGWDARSKPAPMWDRMFRVKPELPQISEDEEVRISEQRGDDLNAGYEMRDSLPGKDYDVDGILLPRPFKIIKGGPISLFTADIEAAVRFYSHEMGLRISEEVVWNGARCVFLRANTEHHTIALYPIELRAQLGLRPDSTTFSVGIQVGSYRQLRDARAFLEQRGRRFIEIPAELHPGIDYAFHVLDPDGQAVQVYFSMEQIGWDGLARPASSRPYPKAGTWPAVLAGEPDVYGGETLLGPLG